MGPNRNVEALRRASAELSVFYQKEHSRLSAGYTRLWDPVDVGYLNGIEAAEHLMLELVREAEDPP